MFKIYYGPTESVAPIRSHWCLTQSDHHKVIMTIHLANGFDWFHNQDPSDFNALFHGALLMVTGGGLLFFGRFMQMRRYDFGDENGSANWIYWNGGYGGWDDSEFAQRRI